MQVESFSPPPLASHHATETPLPPEVKSGLIAVGTFGLLSFVTAACLFAYMTFSLVSWHRSPPRRPVPASVSPSPQPSEDGVMRHQQQDEKREPDLSLGLEAKYLCNKKAVDSSADAPKNDTDSHASAADGANVHPSMPDAANNPFLTYLYNLVIADLFQALGYMLCLVWVASDGVFVPSTTCWSQGWFTNIGTIGPGGLLVVISINTYLTVVWGYRPSRIAVYCFVTMAWIVAFSVPSIPIFMTNNGWDKGGWYVRVHCWCQINLSYPELRFWFEYFWIILAIMITAVLYALMFISLWRSKQSSQHLPATGPMARPQSPMRLKDGSASPQLSGHHPAFLVYPVIYFLSITPLLVGRLIEINGGQLGNTYHYAAGCLLASQGFLNTILWTTTIIMLSRESRERIGLDRFMRTPSERQYGNMVWIQGGDETSSIEPYEGSWWKRWLARASGGRSSSRGQDHYGSDWSSKDDRGSSQETLRHSSAGNGKDRGAIQLETITTVVVEKEDGRK